MGVKTALVATGLVLLLAGVGLAIWAQAAEAPAQAALNADCFAPGMDVVRCNNDIATISTWSLVFWLGVVLAIIAVVLVIVGAAWESLSEKPAAIPSPMAQPPVCPTCGRPIMFVPQYGRWFCPAEGRYL